MDKFDHVLGKSFEFEKNGTKFTFRYRRTPNAFRAEILTDNKAVSSSYAMYIKNGKAEIRRVYTDERYRGLGLASITINAILEDFGKELEFHLTPGPNRSSYINDENMEEWRGVLVEYYKRFGFIRTSDKSWGMVRRIE
jgi:GNAT superfamily N-acetyltransferase